MSASERDAATAPSKKKKHRAPVSVVFRRAPSNTLFDQARRIAKRAEVVEALTIATSEDANRPGSIPVLAVVVAYI